MGITIPNQDLTDKTPWAKLCTPPQRQFMRISTAKASGQRFRLMAARW